ncbi:MAG TPA: formate dehydrogenase accessory sulfurtransferase FdhD [Sporichthyaceae bacterium]|jgi:FdhD protein
MGGLTGRRPVTRLTPAGATDRVDSLATEEPMELRVDGRPLAVTMRTPGADIEFAHGFLLTEGVITKIDDVRTARYCDGVDDDGLNTYNVLDVTLADGVPVPGPLVERNFYTTSSCGVCGKASLEAVRTRTAFPPGDDPVVVDVEVLRALPDRLRAEQRIFQATGGLHAAGLFDASGELQVIREDVGRHNAVDKVMGWALLNRRIPAAGSVLLLSGRASFELIQKAAMAGVPLVAAISAPSTLAAELAEDAGITLVGFLRGAEMTVYTCRDRVRS